MPNFFDDLADQRVRRVPRALRKKHKVFTGTGHDDKDVVHQHLKRATAAASTDEKRGHVFRALTQLNNRKRAEQKTEREQAQPVSAAGSPTTPVVEMYK